MLFTNDCEFFSLIPMKFHSGITVWASSRTTQIRFPKHFSFLAISKSVLKKCLVYSRIAIVFITSGNSKITIFESLLIKVSIDSLNIENINFLKKYGNYGIDIKANKITKYKIALAHMNGGKVNVWTVNSKEEIKRLSNMGVDMITSDLGF